VLGKAEGSGKLWHGHVTAVTVSPEYRRLGVAKNLMAYLEDVSTDIYNAYFVDLFVRQSNLLAQLMYTNLGYSIYRQVVLYYSGEEDAYDMRKALKRDKAKQSVVPRKPFKCQPHEIEWS
jgi:N-terminal acetyltransferase B complex catalytic subunit